MRLPGTLAAVILMAFAAIAGERVDAFAVIPIQRAGTGLAKSVRAA